AGHAVTKAVEGAQGRAKAGGRLRLGVSARLTQGPTRFGDDDAPRGRKGKGPSKSKRPGKPKRKR
ncbi:MAG TPA: hypothetical protein PKU97_22405, partial [Kofleriaceae bacterium]|nr:hypothetical protein [Kofleriaceae bacterium]